MHSRMLIPSTCSSSSGLSLEQIVGRLLSAGLCVKGSASRFFEAIGSWQSSPFPCKAVLDDRRIQRRHEIASSVNTGAPHT